MEPELETLIAAWDNYKKNVIANRKDNPTKGELKMADAVDLLLDENDITSAERTIAKERIAAAISSVGKLNEVIDHIEVAQALGALTELKRRLFP